MHFPFLIYMSNFVSIGYYFYRAQELSSPGPLHTGPKAHVEEEETPEDEQRESQLPRDIAEDNPVLGQLKS